MSKHNKKRFLSNLRYDLPASIVVFLVAVPLCLGIAMASGAPLFSGIIAGIVGGLVVALISGSPLGVSGPAAGLAVLVLSAIQELGAFETFLLAVVVAGIFQLMLGVLKAGVIGYYFPSSVIKGMLSGIGIIIILKQIPHAVGYDRVPEGSFRFVQADGENTFSELINMLNYISPGAVIITIISMAILILWERPFMKKIPAFKIIQGPLIAVTAGIILHLLFSGTDLFSLHQGQVVNLPVADSFKGFIDLFTMPDFSQWQNPRVYITALTLAVVASLETLLSVEAVDKLDPQKRVTPTNRELTAQGVGNIMSGLIGGLPITQVIVRSSANVQSGGRTRASAFFHGVLLLVCVISIPHVLNLIPLASLAAVLFFVGYKLAKPSLFREMYKKGPELFVPFIVTILGIVFTDLLIGIALGMVVAVFQILLNNYRIPYHFNPDKYAAGEPVKIEMAEEVSFLNKASVMRTLNKLPDGTHVILDGSKIKTIHPDVLEIISDFKDNAATRDIIVETIGFKSRKPEHPEKLFGRVVLNNYENDENSLEYQFKNK